MRHTYRIFGWLLAGTAVFGLAGCGGDDKAWLDRIEISSSAGATVPKGATLPLTATAVFSDGRREDVTAVADWLSSMPSRASVGNEASNKGQVTGLEQSVSPISISASYREQAGSLDITVGAPAVRAVQLTPGSFQLPKGLTRQLVATAVLTDSTTRDVTEQAAWSTSQAAVASVGNTAGGKGLVTGHGIGGATVAAAIEGVSGSAAVTVTAATVASLQVTPSNPSVPLGNTLQFTATAVLSDGSNQNLTASAVWMSSNTGVATIGNASGSKGRATPVSTGTTTVEASFGDAHASTLLTVTDAVLVGIEVTPTDAKLAKNFSLQYSATGLYSDGSTRDITAEVSWRSSNGNAAEVGDSQGSKGLAAGIAAGETTVVARWATVEGATRLIVTDATLSKLDVTPVSAGVPKGLGRQFQATGTFSDNSTQDLTEQVTWSSSDVNVATVSNARGERGQAATLAKGSATIKAVRNNVAAQAALTVTDAALEKIEIVPTEQTVCVEAQQQYSATGTYTDGSTQNITAEVTWTSGDTSIATVSNASGSKGAAKAVGAGVVGITATHAASAKRTTAQLTVKAGTLQALVLTPDNATLPRFFWRNYTVTGEFSDCPNRDVTREVTWSSSNSTLASISNAAGEKGRVLGRESGVVSIRAEQGAVSASTALTVVDEILAGIDVTPKNDTIGGGQSLQFTATGRFSDNSTLNVTEQVNWASSNTNAATISNAEGSKGKATAGSIPGRSEISATRDGVRGATNLTRGL